MLRLALGPRDHSAHLPVFLHLRNMNIPGSSSVMRSEQAQQKDLSADATKNEGRDEVHDHALVHQGHVSVSYLTLLRLPLSLLSDCSSLYLR